jgi:hypothetical protein
MANPGLESKNKPTLCRLALRRAFECRSADADDPRGGGRSWRDTNAARSKGYKLLFTTESEEQKPTLRAPRGASGRVSRDIIGKGVKVREGRRGPHGACLSPAFNKIFERRR